MVDLGFYRCYTICILLTNKYYTMYILKLTVEEKPATTVRTRTYEFESLLEATSRLKSLLFKESRAELPFEILDYAVEHSQTIMSMGDIDNLLKERHDEGIEERPSQKVA